MRAEVAETPHVRGRVVGTSDETSEVRDIRGREGQPTHLVRHDDGHESARVPEVEGIAMSTADEGRLTEAAILDLVEDSISTTTHEGETSKPYDDARDATLAPTPWPPSPPGPVIPVRIAPSQKAYPYSFNDPSNYLG